METNPTRQRLSFLGDYASSQWSMSELCQRCRVSRPTGHKSLKRVEEEGESRLGERSRGPRNSPLQMHTAIEQQILEVARRFSPTRSPIGTFASRRRTTGLRNIVCCRTLLGRIDERTGAITGVRRRRRCVKDVLGLL
jgi:hypothetical protein